MNSCSLRTEALKNFSRRRTADLLLNSLGLTGLGSLSHVDGLLVLDNVGGDVLATGGNGSGRGNLHGDVMSEGLELLGRSGLGLLEGELAENADLATHVDVGGEGAGLDGAEGEAGDLHVLADDVDELGKLGLDGLTVHRSGHESLGVGGLDLGDDLGELGSEAGELGVRGDEVGLAGKLDQGAGLAVLGDVGGDGALVGLAAAFLAALARPFLRRTSTAASMSPSASTSAFLHSIIGESVISRSCLTIAAVIWAMMAPFSER